MSLIVGLYNEWDTMACKRHPIIESYKSKWGQGLQTIGMGLPDQQRAIFNEVSLVV